MHCFRDVWADFVSIPSLASVPTVLAVLLLLTFLLLWAVTLLVSSLLCFCWSHCCFLLSCCCLHPFSSWCSHCCWQCCGSMTFWCGSGSGSRSMDPCIWLMNPDPAIFIIDLQDANIKQIKKKIFSAYYFLKVVGKEKWGVSGVCLLIEEGTGPWWWMSVYFLMGPLSFLQRISVSCWLSSIYRW